MFLSIQFLSQFILVTNKYIFVKIPKKNLFTAPVLRARRDLSPYHAPEPAYHAPAHPKGTVGPVYTFVKTDPHVRNFILFSHFIFKISHFIFQISGELQVGRQTQGWSPVWKIISQKL